MCPCREIDKRYSKEWDAHYCGRCNIWLEEKCGGITDKECWFQCWKRPDRPFSVIKDDGTFIVSESYEDPPGTFEGIPDECDT